MDSAEEDNCEISCFKLPLDLLDKDTAKQHFKQFGRIIKMSIRLKSRTCLVLYADRHSAAQALFFAGKYDGEEFIVRWAKPKDRLPAKKIKVKKELDPDWSTDPEVKAELAAMEELVPKSYNLRPEYMSVDPSEPPTSHKKPERNKSRRREREVPAPKAKISDTSTSTSNVQKIPSDQIELYKLIKQQATTVEEKYRILETKDKLLRLRTKKQSDLTKATRTIGTCPDMCPEKERLMREVQHQVALYEQGAGGREMNHSIAVKQYSRSSADQEVPLPHELRPVNVLHLTMGYLLNKIMDLCVSPGVNLAEWFHFLWDRTRAIRKDITQQELCCQGSVELVEQCARFHIHCSARLVAEEPSVFDQKINTENLTKCLQTLKYMYHDLALKNVQCLNEAEFRAYIVLLNLNDGNFMWEVQNLSEHIKKSPQMRFAIQVYSALDKNNYVKFFKLVRSTTYLNACILLRYFIQVRSRAINLMLKCYAPRKPTSFPVEELTNLLAFEDDGSTIDFMEYYGLCANENKTHVIFDKRSYMSPEIPYLLDRATNIIESKRRCTVGETVCGKPLPLINIEKHILQNSFDSNGYLITSEGMFDLEMKSHDSAKSMEEKEYLKPTIQNVSSSATSTSNAALISQAQAKEKSANIFSTAKIMEGVSKPSINEPYHGSIFSAPKVHPTIKESRKSPMFPSSLDVADGNNKELPKQSIWEVNRSTSTCKSVDSFKTEHRIPSTISEMFGFSKPTVINETHTFPPSEHKQSFTFQKPKPIVAGPNIPNSRAQSIFTAPKSQLTFDHGVEQNDMQTQKLSPFPVLSNKQMQKLADELKDKQEQERKMKEKERKEEKLKQERLRMEQQEELLLRQKLLEEKRRREQQELKRKQELEIRHNVANVLKYLVNSVVEIENERKDTENKLKVISTKVWERKLRANVAKWKKYVALKKRKRKIMEQSPTWLSNRSISEEAKELFTESQNMTLQCVKRYKLGKSLNLNIPQERPLEKLNIHQLVYSILNKNCLTHCGISLSEIFWKISIIAKGHSLEVINQLFKWEQGDNPSMAIENYEVEFSTVTYCVEKYNPKKNDSKGLIYIINNLDDQDVFDESAISIPIAVIIRSKSCDYDETTCGNKIFVDNIGSTQNLANVIGNACQWLAMKSEISPPLELDILKSFLQKNLGSEMCQRILTYAKGNNAFKQCLQLPNVAIKLYNEAVDRLQTLILDDSNFKHADFPNEVKPFLKQKIPLWLPCDYRYFPSNWKSSKYRDALRRHVENLKLPLFYQQWPPKENELEFVIIEYCKMNFKDIYKVYNKIMAVILREITNDYDKDIKKVLWPEIVDVIVNLKLDSLRYEYTEFENIFRQYYVVYKVESLAKYRNEAWFYINNSIVASEVQNKLQIQAEKAQKRLSNEKENLRNNLEDFHVDLDKAMNEAINLPIRTKGDMAVANKQLAEFTFLLDDLEKSLKIQKVISDRFEKTVNAVLHDK